MKKAIAVLLLIQVVSYGQEVLSKKKPTSGTMQGTVVDVKHNEGKLYTITISSGKTRYQFLINGRMKGQLVKTAMVGDVTTNGASVRVTYKGMELSEMDAFYTAYAVKIVRLMK